MSKQIVRLSKQRLRNFQGLPLEDVFTQTYNEQLWGANTDPFFSGTGSHDKAIVRHSINVLTSLIGQLKPAHILDIGCGDFNIGKHLAALCDDYTGVDVVADLISFNQQNFSNDSISFICLNACEDLLPAADLVIIRQVLQHLSNRDIIRMMNNLRQHNKLVITEHLPEGQFDANKDKPSGPDSRLRLRSGVDLQKPPFSLSNYHFEQIGMIPEPSGFGGVLQTLYMEKL